MPERFFAALFVWSAFAATAPAAPNILLVITDDQGYGDVSAHENPWIKTPHMDRIAAEGARFERFFVEPVCAPTRAALLTGRFPARTGVHGVTRNEEVMRSNEVTLAELLRDEARYATGCFGKWHNGAHWPWHPNAQGFDEFFGFCAGHWNDYFDPVLERNGKPQQTRGFIADVITDEAIAFIDRSVQKDAPFFCYVPYNTPHTPASVPAADWDRWRDRTDVEDTFTRTMYALCENIDHNLGRLLAKLEKLNIERNTIVLFLTDNGPNGERFNDGMLGRKGSEHEGGVRVPLFVRWPGKIKAGKVIERNAAHIDLLPTLCAMAGINHPGRETLPLDGIDLSTSLYDEHEEGEWPDRRFFVWRNPNRWSIRTDRYRATARTLHDLVEDPGQKKNLAKEKAGIHAELVAEFLQWESSVGPADLKPPPIQVGHAERPKVTIKAHEFEIFPQAGKGIDFCERAGFANQWIDGWTDMDAFAECPVEVVTAGRYKVTFRYACPPTATGSIFKLSAGSTAIDIKITDSWVSAVYPASEQFSKRSGGYLSREWKDVAVGELELKMGTFPLQLRALKKPDDAMPDFKAVILERL